MPEAIQSVRTQIYNDIELIIVDDGSTDDTPRIIHSYGDQIIGIRKANGGVASALNAGIRCATGAYIAWLSHDDLFLPQKIERQVAFLEANQDCKACYTDYCCIDACGEMLHTVRTPWYPRRIAIRKLFSGVYINGSTMLIDKECFDRLGLFREDLKYTQDVEMWFRILQCYEIGRIPEVLVSQRVHSEQTSIVQQCGHAGEEQEIYCELFERLGPSAVLDCSEASADDPVIQAKACRWFGDRMSIDRNCHALAWQQYRRSLDHWPSWRNSAWIGLFLSRAVWPKYRSVRYWLGNRLKIRRRINLSFRFFRDKLNL